MKSFIDKKTFHGNKISIFFYEYRAVRTCAAALPNPKTETFLRSTSLIKHTPSSMLIVHISTFLSHCFRTETMKNLVPPKLHFVLISVPKKIKKWCDIRSNVSPLCPNNPLELWKGPSTAAPRRALLFSCLILKIWTYLPTHTIPSDSTFSILFTMETTA